MWACPSAKPPGRRLSAASPHPSFLLACGLSASIRHAKCGPPVEPVPFPIGGVVAVWADNVFHPPHGNRSASSPFVESIALPILWIVADVFRNAFVFATIADHAVPIIALPNGRAVRQQPIAVRHARNRGFVGPHDAPQRTHGNDGHSAFQWCVGRGWTFAGIGGWACAWIGGSA